MLYRSVPRGWLLSRRSRGGPGATSVLRLRLWLLRRWRLWRLIHALLGFILRLLIHTPMRILLRLLMHSSIGVMWLLIQGALRDL